MLLMEGTVKANFGVLSGCNGRVKKESFRSTIRMSQEGDIIVGEGIPSCNVPMLSITELIFLRSWSNLHLPDFFFMTKTRVFQGLRDGSMCP